MVQADALGDGRANACFEVEGATTDGGTVGGVAGGVGLDVAYGLVGGVGWWEVGVHFAHSVFAEHESCGETVIGTTSS